jgi:uncharacterized OB-fold protein
LDEADLIAIDGKWNFNFRYYAGESASRFFHELRENRRIMGTRCSKCRRLLVPARSFCDACMERTDEWKEVGPEGTLETFTIITTIFPGLPPPPIVMAYVTLDGADTALINIVEGLDVTDVNEAAKKLNKLPRVKTKFIGQPKGRITDFSFELI